MRRGTTQNVITLLVIAAAVGFFYSPLLSAHNLTTGADMTSLFFPSRVLLARSLREGIIPLWNPYKFGGSPFLAPMQSGVLYFPNWIFSYFFPAIMGTNLFILFHIWLLGIFTYYLLVKAFGVIRWIALPFSLVIPFCGIVQAQVEHLAALAAITWIPLMILLYKRFLKKPGGRSACWFSIALAMQILSGHPQYVAYTLFFLLLYTVYWMFSHPDKPATKNGVLLVAFFLLVFFSFVVSAAQVLPTLEHSRHTYRALSGFEYASSFSMPPRLLLTFLNPYIYRLSLDGADLPNGYPEYNAFCGIMPLFLFLFALGYVIARRDTKGIFLFVVSLLFLLFALGNHTPFFKLMLSVFPFLAQYRVPSRILILVNLIWIIVAAHTLSILFSKKISPARIPYLALFLSCIFFLDLYANSRREAFNFTVPFERIQNESFPWSGVIDSSQEFYYRVYRLMTQDDDYFLLPDRKGVVGRFLRLQPDLNILFSIPLVGGYEEGLLPSIRYKDFLLTYNRNLRNPSPDTLLLSLLNVRYLYLEPGLKASSKELKSLTEGAPPELFENRAWQGGAFWEDELNKVVRLDLLDGTFERTGALHYSFGTEFISDYMRSPDVSLPESVSHGLDFVYEDVNTITLTCNKGEGDVVVSLPAYSGWIMQRDNGSLSDVEPVNALMQRVRQLSAPTTAILHYEPSSFRIGLYFSFLSILTLVVFFILSGRMPIKNHEDFIADKCISAESEKTT